MGLDLDLAKRLLEKPEWEVEILKGEGLIMIEIGTLDAGVVAMGDLVSGMTTTKLTGVEVATEAVRRLPIMETAAS